MKSVPEILATLLNKEGDDIEIFDLPDLVENWPTVIEDEGETEPLDMENYEILVLNDKELKMCAGGDWQDQLTFTLVASGDKLKVTHSTKGFSDGMRWDDVLKILKENQK